MSAAMEDAGAFQCNVTNEHGSATINITLIVVGTYTNTMHDKRANSQLPLNSLVYYNLQSLNYNCIP